MPNDFSRLDPSQAVKAAQAVTTVVSHVPNAYSFSQDQLSGLTQGYVALANAVNDQFNAEVAAKAATEAKNAALAALRSALSALAKSADANPTITDGMLKAIGFASRPSGGSRPRALAAPTGLMVEAMASGQAKLTWSRDASTKINTVFSLWSSENGLDFSMIGAVTKASFLVEDAPAGTAAWYRITASRGNVTSPPSASVSIYAPSAAAAQGAADSARGHLRVVKGSSSEATDRFEDRRLASGS